MGIVVFYVRANGKIYLLVPIEKSQVHIQKQKKT